MKIRRLSPPSIGVILAVTGLIILTYVTTIAIHLMRESECTALWSAAESGSNDDVKRRLDQGDDPNCDNCAPLIGACKREHADTVQLLLEYGAKVGAKDKDGMTALDYARGYLAADPHDPDALKIIALLRRYGAK